eukprot:m.311883 g.311883  ORF g.311883 m.311883 type:complete len:57 (+) comp169801_c0_seq1:146-316(+)
MPEVPSDPSISVAIVAEKLQNDLTLESLKRDQKSPQLSSDNSNNGDRGDGVDGIRV